ncbi:chemotaxis protein CheB [Sporocytophaga myxococcoides]|uniref:chemotaxis protein CheB n=1 Tax=Sporocytophaga myxococcoides TaxID=153721 RepID=UPI0004146786|nr:chemotaxis protein CheB [Sporocytophaga myxococcoides]
MKEVDLNRKYKAIVIGGSAGSFQVLCKILNKLPEDFSLPIFICCHRLKHIRNGLIEALSLKSIKEVKEPDHNEPIKRGKIYLAPANYHMNIELGNYISLSTEEMVNNSRPAIDITFETCAYVYKEKLIGILLTGANKDGALGMKKVKDYGGMTIIQDPEESVIDTMPKAAMSVTKIDHVMKVEEIIKFLIELNKVTQL